MVLFITLYEVFLACESVGEILKCNQLNQSHEKNIPVMLSHFNGIAKTKFEIFL